MHSTNLPVKVDKDTDMNETRDHRGKANDGGKRGRRDTQRTETGYQRAHAVPVDAHHVQDTSTLRVGTTHESKQRQLPTHAPGLYPATIKSIPRSPDVGDDHLLCQVFAYALRTTEEQAPACV